ncbi:MAG: bacterial Ig-like domain-containing protein, partial [Treponema sp.]|nr:bacterial Ig-like domain-containing protein [Treponema sp.]
MEKRNSGRRFGAAAGIGAVTGFMLLCITAWGLTSCEGDPAREEGNKITSFKVGDVLGVIEEVEQTIVVFVPTNTNLQKVAPVVTVSSKASLFPESGTEVDIRHPVSYTVTAENGASRTYKVTVNVEAPTVGLESIAIRTLPTRTIYEIGETFDPSGLVVVGIYSDGSVREETEYTLDPSPVLTASAGSAPVTVSVRGKTAPAFTVTVRIVRLESISVTTLKDSYAYGEALDPAGIAVTGLYSDGTTETEVPSSYAVTGYDPEKSGSQTLLVTLNGKTATFTVMVGYPDPSVDLNSITITTLKDSYAYGEELDPLGIVVRGYYSNGTDKIEAAADYTVTGYNPEKSGSQTLLVTLGGKTATFAVTVGYPDPEVTLSSISVTTLKDSYAYGEELDPTGIVVRGYYSDGTDSIEPAGEYTITGYNPEKSGSQTLLVTLEGKTATFTVNVGYPVTLNSIGVTTLKTSYAYGEELDPEGIVVRGYYSDGTDTIEPAADYTITGYNPEKSGYQTLLVTLNRKTTTFTVTVGNKPVERDISVSIGLPNTNQEPEIFGIPEGGIKLSTGKNGLSDRIVISVANNGGVYSNVTWYIDGS